MYSTWWYFVFFLIALGILVTVHEFGHFYVARFFGVKVYRFSLGFGKKLFSWRDKKGTEFIVAAIPLGGYVKMADEYIEEIPEEDKPFSFRRKSLFARASIVLAGPLFNFFLAMLAFTIAFSFGYNSLKPIIGSIQAHTIFSDSGFQKGDQIVAINGERIYRWSDFIASLMKSSGENKLVSVEVVPENLQQPIIRNVQLTSTSLNFSGDIFEKLGFKPFEPAIPLEIARILPQSPAAKAGILPGDWIFAIEGKKINSWQELLSEYQQIANNKDQISLVIIRDGKLREFKVKPQWELLKGKKILRIGIESKPFKIPEKYVQTQKYSFFYAVFHGVEKTITVIFLTCILIGKLIIGKLSLSSLSGPIGIAQGAGITAGQGLSSYLDFLATLSVSLGILNLLPIPILDGGHLLFFLIEAIRGKPISVETQLRATQIGLVIILILTVVGVSNDIKRIWL